MSHWGALLGLELLVAGTQRAGKSCGASHFWPPGGNTATKGMMWSKNYATTTVDFHTLVSEAAASCPLWLPGGSKGKQIVPVLLFCVSHIKWQVVPAAAPTHPAHTVDADLILCVNSSWGQKLLLWHFVFKWISVSVSDYRLWNGKRYRLRVSYTAFVLMMPSYKLFCASTCSTSFFSPLSSLTHATIT